MAQHLGQWDEMTDEDPLGVRDEFPVTRSRTYLNTPYIGPISKAVRDTAVEYADEKLDWAASRHRLENEELARSAFADLFEVKTEEVALLYSTSDGENIVTRGLDLDPGDNVVVDELHFPTTFVLYRQLEKARGIELRIVPQTAGRVRIEDFETHIDQRTRLISVAWVSNRNGYRHDLRSLADLAHANDALLYADAVQALGTFPANLTELGVDFVTSGSYKWLFANFGVAPFFIREEHLDRIRPDRYGHTQISEKLSDHRFRLHSSAAKYEYASLAFGPVAQLATALEFLKQIGLSRIEAHTTALARELRENLSRLGFDLLTPVDNPSPIVSFVHRCDPTQLKSLLDEKAIDVTFREEHDEVIRLGVAMFNNRANVAQVVKMLETVA